MELKHGTVVAVADGEHFKLYRNTSNDAHPKLEAIGEPKVDDSNRSAGVHRPNTGATGENTRGLEEAGHAAGTVDYLNQQVLQHKIDSLVIIADPRSLGEMRRHYHKELEGALIGEIAKDLSNNPLGDIEHALVQA